MIGEKQETAIGLKYDRVLSLRSERVDYIASVLVQLLLYVIRFTLFITSV